MIGSTIKNTRAFLGDKRFKRRRNGRIVEHAQHLRGGFQHGHIAHIEARREQLQLRANAHALQLELERGRFGPQRAHRDNGIEHG